MECGKICKINVLIAVMIVSVGAVIAVYFFAVLPSYRSIIFSRNFDVIEHAVKIASEAAGSSYALYAEGKMSEFEAKKTALGRIREMFYGMEGRRYIFIMDRSGKVVSYPVLPFMEGKKLQNLTGKNGEEVYEKVKKAVTQGNEGYAEYLWTDPVTKQESLKKTYVYYFKPWNWYIGSGIQYEEVEKEIGKINLHAMWYLAVVLALMILVSVIVISGALREEEKRRINEIKQLKLLEELKDANAELERFAYVAAHDLRDPMRTVSISLEVFFEDYYKLIPEKGRGMLDDALRASQRMHFLIKELLDYSRIGKTAYEFTEVDLNLVFKTVMQNLAASVDETCATVINKGLPTVRGATLYFILLFQNLISNALKFRRNGEKPVIETGYNMNGNVPIIYIKDNGIGIEEKYFERIFGVFERLHNEKAFPGTGIGLAVCKRIMEVYGGKIWVESVPGLGTTFKIMFQEDSAG